MPHLERDDIILDCGNEHFANTERRQHKVEDTGIRYIGCGVSGGYQAARAGPSMCPGGDQSALKEVLPLLEKVAAKDKNEKPCVGIVGTGGSGHYVKMVHNGIEHGMMSAICETWGIMRKMGMGYEEIGDILKGWDSSGELVCLTCAMQSRPMADSVTRKGHFSSQSAQIYHISASKAPQALTKSQVRKANIIPSSSQKPLIKWSKT